MLLTRDKKPAGNTYDKYGSKNPIVKWMMAGFFKSFEICLEPVDRPTRILDVGCGEGVIANWLAERYPGAEIVALDYSDELVDIARERSRASIQFQVASATELPFPDASFDLVISSEVMEHLDDPERALAEVARVTSRHAFLSVPKEPIWRMMNMARGAYWNDLGNTPGHIQHWSKQSFIQLVSMRLKPRVIQTPFPWTQVLAEK